MISKPLLVNLSLGYGALRNNLLTDLRVGLVARLDHLLDEVGAGGDKGQLAIGIKFEKVRAVEANAS